MEVEIHLGGSGGQGILLIGNMLAYGGLQAGLEISWIPSYGAERRGGVSFCAVTLADHAIACPVTDCPDLVLAMDNRALSTHAPRLRKDGLLILNENLVTIPVPRKEVRIFPVPFNRLANEKGAPFSANMVGLGAILRLNPGISLEQMKETLPKVLGAKKARFVEGNLLALQSGYDYAQDHFSTGTPK